MGGKKKQQTEKVVPAATLAALRVRAHNPTLTHTQVANEVNDALVTYGIVFTAQEVEVYRLSRFNDYFLNSKTNVVQVETIELTHPAFTKVYRLVRNATKGVTVTLETGGTAVFEYYPMKISAQHAREDLDQTISITFGDLGTILPLELDRVMTYSGGMEIKPVVKYRIYRSDDYTAPLYGPLTLEAEAFTFDKYGATFEAKAPSINLTKTGEIYNIARFPGLVGFL